MNKLIFLPAVFFIFLMGASSRAGTELISDAATPVRPERAPEPFSFFSPNIEVFFSPGDACVNAVVREILKAKSSVRILTTQMNLADVATALAKVRDDRNRNVEVTVIFDQTQVGSGGGETRRYLKGYNIRMLVDTVRPVDSNVIIIDKDVVLSGSGPLTVQATQAAGNLIVIRNNQRIINAYSDYWDSRIQHARTAALSPPRSDVRSANTTIRRRKVALR